MSCKSKLYISTLSALTPQGSVASSREFCMTWLIVSRSLRISARFLVPKTFLRVVAAKRRVEWLKKSNRTSSFLEILRGWLVSTHFAIKILHAALHIPVMSLLNE